MSNHVPIFDVAYPPELRAAEQQLLGTREPKIGLALSGGGIRSATFCLGVLQALCRTRRLGRVAFLSTVSGGGYIGSFLGRLYHRPYVRSAEDVERILTGPPPANSDPPTAFQQATWKVLGWLRENGRYLSPRGAGDLLLGGVVLLRNWFSIHMVLGVFFLALFLALQLPRTVWASLLQAGGASTRANAAGVGLLQRLPFDSTLWWSPWILVALALLVLAVPSGWAYWLVPRSQKPSAVQQRRLAGAWIGIVISILLGVVGSVYLNNRNPADQPHRAAFVGAWAGVVLAIAAVMAAISWSIAMASASRYARSFTHLSLPQVRLFRDAECRHGLSTSTLRWLTCAAVVLAIALVDTIAQTLYAYLTAVGIKRLAISLVAGFATLAGIARQLTVMVGARPDGRRPGLPLSIVAGAVAATLVVTLLVSIDLIAHAVAWDFGNAAFQPQATAQTTVTLSAPASQHITLTSVPGPESPTVEPFRRAPALLVMAWLVATGLLALGVGRAFAFLNQSSHQMLYAARLTRAYLGASNAERWLDGGPNPAPVVDPVPGDDIEVHEYWQPPGPGSPSSRQEPRCQDRPDVYAKGMPLHLVNVTINETYDGQSQTQQQDRKGIGMALGPAGMSVGIRHHVVLQHENDEGPDGRRYHVSIKKVYPESGFKVFSFPRATATKRAAARGPEFPWDPLSFGRWISISGAAFSTGIGSRTSLGLSLLAGLANVRLGYWWDSGIDPSTRKEQARARLSAVLQRKFSELFPVQSFLLSEFVARFPGTAQRRWYLSDGGHFENMGGYELVRRRLPLILIVDAEADPEYTFEGLSNLVRKARLDFQTEITFLDDAALLTRGLGPLVDADDPDSNWARLWGPLERLRPSGESESKDAAVLRYSPARFAMASILYPADNAGPRTGTLIYVKPTLMGDEPADVIQYARANRPFPQQTTADQFFDEAQWESYRRLGEFVGTLLLDAPPTLSNALGPLQ